MVLCNSVGEDDKNTSNIGGSWTGAVRNIEDLVCDLLQSN